MAGDAATGNALAAQRAAEGKAGRPRRKEAWPGLIARRQPNGSGPMQACLPLANALGMRPPLTGRDPKP